MQQNRLSFQNTERGLPKITRIGCTAVVSRNLRQSEEQEKERLFPNLANVSSREANTKGPTAGDISRCNLVRRSIPGAKKSVYVCVCVCMPTPVFVYFENEGQIADFVAS